MRSLLCVLLGLGAFVVVACSSNDSKTDDKSANKGDDDATGDDDDATGDDDATTGDDDDDSKPADAKFNCSMNKQDKNCDPATSYCIVSQNSSGEQIAAACVPIPSGCEDCDCAADDAEAAFTKAQKADNCKGADVTCELESGEIHVTCKK